MSLLDDPLIVDGVTVGHTFDTDVSLVAPVTLDTCAEHSRRLAHWSTLAVKAACWHQRLVGELAMLRVRLMAQTVQQADGLTAMANAMAAKTGGTKASKGPTLHKWKVEAQAETTPEYVEKAREVAHADETARKLAEWVTALRERGRMIDNMVALQTGSGVA